MLRSLTLLLLLAAAVALAAAKRPVQCPELQAASVCAQAEAAGFAYSDGCNRVRCLAGGIWAASRRGCPSADSPAERRHCRRAAQEAFARLGPLACANVDPERVCASRGDGFGFSDGCNGLVCAGDGSVGSGTMRACPDGDPEGAYCRFVEDLVGDDDEEKEEADEEGEETGDHRASTDGSDQRRRRRSQQEFACPDLSAAAICKRSTSGFTYSDGCNAISCHGDGTGQTTFKYCPAPEASDAAGQAYCQAAERDMRAKMQRASLRSRCLEPADVCRGGAAASRTAYNNGCNRCFCSGPGEAACTRRACPKVLMTDEEFAQYCEQRGAGIH